MPKIKRRIQKQNLSNIRTWIVDDNPFSEYFRLTQIPETFPGGKTGFLINGSPNLIRTTEVLVEIIDADGNTIFCQPIKNYQEGLARVISVEVYEDTAPGPALLTILGELAFDNNGERVPDEWIGTYNVKWQKIINVDPGRPNTNAIRLYKKPVLNVTEQLIPYRQIVTGSVVNISTGSLTGQFIPGGIQFVGDDINNQQRIVIQPHTVITSNTPIFVRQSAEGTLATLVNGNSFTSSLLTVLNDSVAYVPFIITGSDGNPLQRWNTSEYTHSYQAPSTFITSSLIRSFAEIHLTNLTTFTGDIQRAKFYAKGNDEGQKFTLLEDIILEATELTVSQSITGEQVQLGEIIDQVFINDNWEDGIIFNGNSYSLSGDVTGSYNSSELIDSIVLQGTFADTVAQGNNNIPLIWCGIKQDLIFENNAEYTFSADILCIKDNTDFDGFMEVYLDGPVLSAANSLGTKIAEFRVEKGQRRRLFHDVLHNFVMNAADQAKLRFVIYGGRWYISNTKIISSRETGFNPDEITILSPIIGRRFENLQFKAELYDANSNLVPLNIETDPIYFDGGNFVLRGPDTRIDGLLTVAPSGSGITMGNIGSGSFLGIRSGGIATPIDPDLIASYTGSPQISLYSGTFFGQDRIGFQVVGVSGSESTYLDFNSGTGRLTIRGDIQVLPGTDLSGSIHDAFAAAMAASSSAALASGTAATAFNELIALANGVRPSGTFINGNSIVSPNIAGQNGFFSQIFGVGNIAGNNGIILSALGYTSSLNTPVSGAPAIYIGQGKQFDANTPFLVASSSNGSVMSLGDKFNFEPSGNSSTMTVRGRIFVDDPTTGQISEFNDVRKVIANRIAFGPFGFYISNL